MANDVAGLDVLRNVGDDSDSRHDIYIGLVSPIGSSRSEVVSAIKDELDQYGYEMVEVHLATLLDLISQAKLPERNSSDYYQARMDAGDKFRDSVGDYGALAALAIAKAAHEQHERVNSPDCPVAYVFNSLKHPREDQLFRSVYGSAFWTVAIVQDHADRLRNLSTRMADAVNSAGRVPEAEALSLITRDEADSEAKNGQNVRDVFSMADFFLPVQDGVPWKERVTRFFQGVFGSPFLTPEKDEEAMRLAQAASLRSAAVGRQVGAAILPIGDAPVLVGTNEVPKAGGGQYREGDVPDHRDFQSGVDPNPAFTDRVIRELIARLAEANYFTEERNAAGAASILSEASQPGENGKSILDGTRAKALIEFTRCLHAEQAAILDAARTGVAIGGGRLFTTTFPCHECTKLIVGAGIVEVQYIEPYPKSLASDLFYNMVETSPPLGAVSKKQSEADKVPFIAFTGFGPRRYDTVFVAANRRSDAGLAKHVKRVASPIGVRWSRSEVRDREDRVVVAIRSAVDDIKSRVQVDSAPKVATDVEQSTVANG